VCSSDLLAGLAEVLDAHGACLIGGDTVALPAGAPRVLTVTALGSDAAAPARSGAQAGDALWVTGTIGDAGAGLAIAQGADGPPELAARYRRPTPRLAEGRILSRVAHAMMDVSDGLLIDAARMGEASGLAVHLDLAMVPLSAPYRAYAGSDRAARLAAATAGDDYELLFAMPANVIPAVAATRLGRFARGSGLHLSDAGTMLDLPARLGFEHAETVGPRGM
jgi:thiamine-monophosphate kinase